MAIPKSPPLGRGSERKVLEKGPFWEAYPKSPFQSGGGGLDPPPLPDIYFPPTLIKIMEAGGGGGILGRRAGSGLHSHLTLIVHWMYGVGTGGPSPQFGYATPPPPRPPPCPPGPLSYRGSTAPSHTYGGAKGARKFFPLPT